METAKGCKEGDPVSEDVDSELILEKSGSGNSKPMSKVNEVEVEVVESNTSTSTSSDSVVKNWEGDSQIADEVEKIIEKEQVQAMVTASNLEKKEKPCSSTTNAGPPTIDPYAYLDRDEFSSERYKIELNNLPKFYGYSELKKLINKKLNLKSHKIKVMTGGSKCAFVNFRSEEERTHALEVLNHYTWKKSTLSATVAKPAQDPLVRKRIEDSESPSAKRSKVTDDEPPLSVNELVKNQTIPWWKKAYSEQLLLKNQQVKEFMTILTKKLCAINSAIPKKPEGELICSVEAVQASPVTEEYRNKCEFTIGYNPETNDVTVGFRLSSYRAGSTYVGPVSDLFHLPLSMRVAAAAFEDYIRSTDLKPYDPETHEGVWKQLTIRTTLAGKVMMIAILEIQKLTPKEIGDVKESIKSHFTKLENLNITSFYVKEAEKHGRQKSNLPDLLYGEEVLIENVCELQFRISPESFFQVNTRAAEILYSSIADLATVSNKTSVIDVCCGTGTIAIFLAKKSGESIGVELVLDAVRDATLNAKLNGLSEKCQFVAGKAEVLMDIVIDQVKFPTNIVAVVDPPRGGLHSRVIQSIRKMTGINYLVYVACDVNSAKRNIIDLCRPTSRHFKGSHFIPTKLVPVDLFPHTPHLECIFFFERMNLYGQSK